MEYRPGEYKLADIGEPYGHKLTEYSLICDIITSIVSLLWLIKFPVNYTVLHATHPIDVSDNGVFPQN